MSTHSRVLDPQAPGLGRLSPGVDPGATISTPHTDQFSGRNLRRQHGGGAGGSVTEWPFRPPPSWVFILWLDGRWLMSGIIRRGRRLFPSHLGLHIRTDSSHFLTVLVYVTR